MYTVPVAMQRFHASSADEREKGMTKKKLPGRAPGRKSGFVVQEEWE